ncbi:hypothetical protein L2750_10420 [Shewanella submarina]|uniref:Uncharacterized protein n=1 Tax=Shewanella submarina TaxID=2016376 RepID=A0ABV7GF66_9GAMM|nr:hypothetical protein [Shewanella submarina]MCL1037563.1 hypothetical protein [Shewanella submarina]
MISFLHQDRGHTFKLQASNWAGWEKLWVDDKLVSQRFNISGQTEYQVSTESGNDYRLTTLVEPDSQLIICRLYRHHNRDFEHVCSLKQGKNHQQRQARRLYLLSAAAMGSALTLLIW